MAHLTIENSLLIPGTDFDENEEVNRLIADPENHCVVLYPGAVRSTSAACLGTKFKTHFQKQKTRHFCDRRNLACARTMVLAARI